jgi:hypothetical protein
MARPLVARLFPCSPLGENTILVFTLDFPTKENVLAASLVLSLLTGIFSTTSPVIDVKQFDLIIGDIKNVFHTCR